jgi:hypothetical protein
VATLSPQVEVSSIEQSATAKKRMEISDARSTEALPCR